MDRTVEQMQRDIELHLNTIAADQQVFGVTLQVLLLSLMKNTPRGDELFRSIRDQVLGSIDNTQSRADDPQGAERRKQLTKARAEEFFQVLGEAIGVTPDKPDPSDVN